MVVDTQKQDPVQHDVQSRLNAALNMAIAKFAQVGDGRVVSVDADLSALEERRARVPVIIRAHGVEVAQVEKTLAEQVFGPVIQETQVTMPMILLTPNESARSEMVNPDGLLFPLFGR